MVAAPVIHRVISVAVFVRKAFALMEVMVRACALSPSPILIVAPLVAAAIALAFVATLPTVVAALHLFVATALVVTIITFGEGKIPQSQGHRHDGG